MKLDDFDIDEIGESDKINACKSNDHYYKVTLLIRIPHDKFENEWGSSCDETFHLLDNFDYADMVAYNETTEEYYKNHIHDIFTPGGGI